MSYNYSDFYSGFSRNSRWYSDWSNYNNSGYRRAIKDYYNNSNSSKSSSNTNTTTSRRRSSSSNVLDKILYEKKYPTVSQKTQEANSKLTSGISSLKNSVAALQNENTYKTTSDSTTSAADKTVSAVKDYVSMYNDVVGAAKKSTLARKTSHVAGMVQSSSANADKLAEIGITVKRDGTLQLNEDKLKSADISKVQELFSKDNKISYGSTVMSRLGFASLSSGTVQSAGASKDTAADTDTDDKKLAVSGTNSLKEDIEKFTADDAFLEPYSEKYARKAFRGIDIDGIFATTKSFVEHYNSTIDAAKLSTNSSVTSNLAALMEKTAKNKDKLGEFGITLDENGNMTLDEDRLRKSQFPIERFFKDYSSSIATNVSLIDYYMTTQANAASGYTANGTYNTQQGFRFDAAI